MKVVDIESLRIRSFYDMMLIKIETTFVCIGLTPSQECAAIVSDEDLAVRRVYPPIEHIKDVSLRIAVKVADYLYSQNLATVVWHAETARF